MQLVILAIKARAGNTEATGRIFNNLAPSIRSYLSYLTGSTVESEDLLQSTFVKALEGFSGLKNAGSVRTWLFSIAFSEYVRWSKVKRHASVPGEEIASELVLGPDAAILYAEIPISTSKRILIDKPNGRLVTFEIGTDRLEHALSKSLSLVQK